MLVYVSGPYSSCGDIDANIAQARAVAIQLWERGHGVICPHLNTCHFENDCTATWQDYIRGDLDMLAACDAIVMVGDWRESRGAMEEHTAALEWSIPIYEAPDLPALHATEVRCPAQVRAFRVLLGKMYRTHLRKNADYSPANIRGMGELGVAIRVWDKVCRIVNLLGIRLHAEFQGIEPERAAAVADETLEDTWLDLANYGVIGLLNRRKQWGV